MPRAAVTAAVVTENELCIHRDIVGTRDDALELARERLARLERMRADLAAEGETLPDKLEVEHGLLLARLSPSPPAPAPTKGRRPPAKGQRGPAKDPPPQSRPAPSGPDRVTLEIREQTAGTAVGLVQGDLNIHMAGARAGRDVDALEAVRRWVAAGCERLAMRLLVPEQNDASQPDQTPDLARVYVALDTTSLEEIPGELRRPRPKRSVPASEWPRPPRRLSALEVMARHSRLVLLGQPGFGKSTIVRHTALCLARDGLTPDAGWIERLPGVGCRGAERLPVVVVLRDLAATLPERLPAPSGEVIQHFLEAALRAAGLAQAIEPFWDTVRSGNAILFFDGLDEVPSAECRRFVCDALAAFEQLHPRCRYVATCRVLTWAQEKLALRGFETTELASFDDAQIETFVGAWHAELVRQGRMDAPAAERLALKLRAAVASRPSLAALAHTPLLLTVMAVVHTKGGELPEAEASLYREAVEVLLWRWQDTVSAMSPKRLLAEVGARDADLLESLRRLAFEAHRSSPHQEAAHDGVADIHEADLLEALMGLDPDESRQWARRLVDALKTRAGLLLERAPRVYTFPHRTFQELLAGWHLALQRDFEVQAAQLWRKDSTRWRKAVLLAAGLLAAEPRLGELKALIDDLCPAALLDDDERWYEAFCAGELVDVVGSRRLSRSRAERELVTRVRDRLRALVDLGRLGPRARVEAARLLGHIGDPRFRQDAWCLPADETLGFVQIPAGEFWMGRYRVGLSAQDTPQDRAWLPEFWVARYPVTVGQWRAYLSAFEGAHGHAPSPGACDNEPAHLVTWPEAVAYARWLDHTLRGWVDCPPRVSRLLSTGYSVALLSEAEWEKAARGAEGRRWPWGKTFSISTPVASSAETGLGRCPVGCFPAGATPEGIHDLAGNVWEWARSSSAPLRRAPLEQPEPEMPEPDRLALRGGSFEERLPRSAYRFVAHPHLRMESVGFRLALSTRPDHDQ